MLCLGPIHCLQGYSAIKGNQPTFILDRQTSIHRLKDDIPPSGDLLVHVLVEASIFLSGPFPVPLGPELAIHGCVFFGLELEMDSIITWLGDLEKAYLIDDYAFFCA
ncbi:MAG: hypothetical protein ACLFRE_02185 [Desulfovermiculus sp.]